MEDRPHHVAELIDVLDRQVDALAAEVMEEIHRRIPAYGAAQAPPDDDVGAIVRAGLRNWIAGVREQRSPTTDELADLQAGARRRARSGHPLPALLHAYRVGATVAWEALARAARHGDHLDAALQITGWILRYIDEVSTVVTAAYIDERDRAELDGVERARALHDALVAGATPFGCADVHVAVRAVAGERRSVPPLRAIARWLQEAGERTTVPMTADDGDLVILLPVPGVVDERGLLDLAARHGDQLLLAASPPVAAAQIAGAVAEVGQLAAALRSTGGPAIARLEDHLVTALARGWGGRTNAILQALAAPLCAHDAEHPASLVDTVRVLAESTSLAGAARGLHLHRNSLAWRIGQIRSLTGLDPTVAKDLLVLAAAVEST